VSFNFTLKSSNDYDLPTIAARVDYDKERGKYFETYKSFDPDHVDSHTESWLSDTFIPITSNMHGLDWCNSDPLLQEFQLHL
jgi:hypothetical protein